MPFKYGKLVLRKIEIKKHQFYKEQVFFNYDIEYAIETPQGNEESLKENFNFCFTISEEKKIRDEEIDKLIKASMSWLYDKHHFDFDYLACCQAESSVILTINEYYKKFQEEMNIKNI